MARLSGHEMTVNPLLFFFLNPFKHIFVLAKFIIWWRSGSFSVKTVEPVEVRLMIPTRSLMLRICRLVFHITVRRPPASSRDIASYQLVVSTTTKNWRFHSPVNTQDFVLVFWQCVQRYVDAPCIPEFNCIVIWSRDKFEFATTWPRHWRDPSLVWC